MNHNEIREEFKKKFCWQDTDGSWLLNASPNTVPDLLDYFIPKILLSYNAGVEKSIEVTEEAMFQIRETGTGETYKQHKSLSDLKTELKALIKE